MGCSQKLQASAPKKGDIFEVVSLMANHLAKKRVKKLQLCRKKQVYAGV